MSTPRVRLTPLTGANRIGGGIWHVQQGRQGLLLDFGIDLSRSADYLGPRLRLRDTRGLLDPLTLGLLPRFDGLYRQDLILDPEILEDADDLDVRALLLTHFHADHASQVYALDPSIAVHSTLITAAMAHADTVTKTGLASEATHLSPRVPHDREIGILRKPRGVELIPREWHTVDGDVPKRMRELWRVDGTDSGLQRSQMAAANIPYAAHEVDHSLFGTCAYELFTSEGSVVFLTDVRSHGRLGHKTEALVEHMERDHPEVLMLEGTRIGRQDDVRTTERQAKGRIADQVRRAGRPLVVAIVSPNNLERLAAFNAAAQDVRRKLVVSPRVAVMLENVQAANPGFDFGLDDLLVLDLPRASRPYWHQDLRERWASRLVTQGQIRLDARKYVLATTTQRRNELIELKPDGALLIYSSSAAYSDEARGEHAALKLWASMFKMDVVGLLPNGKVDPYLCPSGHLHESDIREICERVRPRRLVPIHCNQPERFKDFVLPGTKVVLPEDGRSIRL